MRTRIRVPSVIRQKLFNIHMECDRMSCQIGEGYPCRRCKVSSEYEAMTGIRLEKVGELFLGGELDERYKR